MCDELERALLNLKSFGLDTSMLPKGLHKIGAQAKQDAGSIKTIIGPGLEKSGVFTSSSIKLRGESVFRINGENSHIFIAGGVSLFKTQISIRSDNCAVLILENCRIGAPTKIIVKGMGGSVVLGQGTTVESGAFLAEDGKNIQLGRDCMLSNHVAIRTSDGHGIWDLETHERISLSQSVTIGNHVWLGNGVAVSKGVSISDGAIVGQRALVTKNIDACTLNAGLPARKIRENVSWSRRGPLEDIPKELRKLPHKPPRDM